jgi:hypothetical protein
MKKKLQKEIDLKQLMLYKSNTLPHTHKCVKMSDDFQWDTSSDNETQITDVDIVVPYPNKNYLYAAWQCMDFPKALSILFVLTYKNRASYI